MKTGGVTVPTRLCTQQLVDGDRPPWVDVIAALGGLPNVECATHCFGQVQRTLARLQTRNQTLQLVCRRHRREIALLLQSGRKWRLETALKEVFRNVHRMTFRVPLLHLGQRVRDLSGLTTFYIPLRTVQKQNVVRGGLLREGTPP